LLKPVSYLQLRDLAVRLKESLGNTSSTSQPPV